MTPAKMIKIASGVAGMAGALALYNGSFAFEQFVGYDNAETIKGKSSRNTQRLWFQRAGLALIFVSFALQIAARFVE
jgi:hypothetical protein